MVRGRKPIAVELKALRGNPGKRPLDGANPDPEGSRPTCPPHLSKVAQAEWSRITKRLEEMGLLTCADRATIAAYCQVWSRWVEAEKTLAREGLITPRGTQSPWIKIAHDSIKLLTALASDLGLSPSARTRVKVKPKKPDKNEYKEFLAGT